MPHEKLESLKERIQRKTKAVKAKKRAKQRRIERREPKTMGERAKVTAEEAKEVGEATKLLAAELGVDPGRAKQIAKNGNQALEKAANNDSLDRLDTDNDGDTDILPALEESLSGGSESNTTSQKQGLDSSEEVGPVRGDQPVVDPWEPLPGEEEL